MLVTQYLVHSTWHVYLLLTQCSFNF
uniref:Uncharacterized protein n=1 Tax=Arundo donax TaxID=35708 RepID=A0A0A9H1D5_ARUDO